MLEASVRPAEESFRKILRLLLEPKKVLPLPLLDEESELGDSDFGLLKFQTMVEIVDIIYWRMLLMQ